MIGEQGSYASLVALVAVFAGITTLLFSGLQGFDDSTQIHGLAMLQTKRHAQNAILVLDKVIGDALADKSALVWGCNAPEDVTTGSPETLVKETIETAIQEMKARGFFSGCTFTVNTVSRADGGYAIDVDISCQKIVDNDITVVYKKKQVFWRSIVATATPPQCEVQIFDRDDDGIPNNGPDLVLEFDRSGTIP